MPELAIPGARPAAVPEPLGAVRLPTARLAFGRGLLALRLVCWGGALLLGAFDAWCPRFAMGPVGFNADGVSYIDLGIAYARGDWAHALNAYWSPLYSWLLALAFRWLHPSAAAEFPVVHGVNFLIFVAALGGFDFLWRTWWEDHQARIALAPRSRWVTLPPWALLVIGYTLFCWSAICWISVQLMSPDLLVAALIYPAAALALRVRRAGSQPGVALCLGIVLGLGCLAKAVMFPLSLLFLLVAIRPAWGARRAVGSLLAAGFAFLCITAPFVTSLSRHEGHFTLGATGRLNYAWYVNHVPQEDWQGEPPGYGTPRHPTRLIYPSPPVYEFAGPMGGTYPAWTDPTYWYAGVRPCFNWNQQARTVLRNLTLGRHQLPWKSSGVPVVALLLLFITVLATRRRLLSLVHGELLLLALAPAALYVLVIIQSRYLGASVVLFGLSLLTAIRLPVRQSGTVPAILSTLLLLLIPAHGLAQVGARDIRQRRAGSADWETAAGLHFLGLRVGDRVGCIGLWNDRGWARLARMVVVAHVPWYKESEYWAASPSVRAAVLRAFARAGAKAVVAGPPPAGSDASGWHRLGSSHRYACLLASAPE